MNLLVIGSGGREHALVWKLAQSPRAEAIWCAPGNAGIAMETLAANGRPVQCLDVAVNDLPALTRTAHEKGIDLTIVGPEVPLSEGLVDRFQAEGLRIWGPNQKAAQFESSKVFSQEFMDRHGIPTMRSGTFGTPQAAKEFARTLDGQVVIKADGLAAGKGVLICHDIAQADHAIEQIMVDKSFGQAGNRVVVQERLDGTEISLHALVDGQSYQLFPSSQDHKRALDGDQGLNTGGMGAYSPAPFLAPAAFDAVGGAILDPWLRGCRSEGIDFRGMLYPGIMVTAEGPKVLEFNVRFGDPETQVYLPRLKNDLIDVLEACIDGTLAQHPLEWSSDHCLCVVMAAQGYPGAYDKGDLISGLADNREGNVKIFHAGTQQSSHGIVTAGGRVLGVTAWAATLTTAREAAYKATKTIRFASHYRLDIGAKALSSSSDH